MMKRSGSAGSLIAVFVLGLLALVLFLGLALFAWYRSGYNRAVRLDEAVDQAWANVDAQLQRRADLVPQLVGAVKGIVQQEQEVFGKIAEARTRYLNADTVQGKISASNALTSLLPNLLALREAYPQLQSNQNFLTLQDQLEGTENRISVARTRYNEAVKALNTYTRELFGQWFCRQAGVEAKPFFEATEQAQTEVPEVDFSSPPPAPVPQ
jgi:LemA protein